MLPWGKSNNHMSSCFICSVLICVGDSISNQYTHAHTHVHIHAHIHAYITMGQNLKQSCFMCSALICVCEPDIYIHTYHTFTHVKNCSQSVIIVFITLQNQSAPSQMTKRIAYHGAKPQAAASCVAHSTPWETRSRTVHIVFVHMYVCTNVCKLRLFVHTCLCACTYVHCVCLHARM
jgi:hypothetical protein